MDRGSHSFSDDTRYALKTTIGCVIALLLVLWAAIPSGAGVVMTVWVLLTMHRAHSLTDGILRILGPIVAGCTMFVALRLFAQSAVLVLLITGVVAYVGFAYYLSGVVPYAGMLMAVIAGIGAAQAGYSPDAATHFALAWVWAAILGVVIVQLISWSIWPDLSPGFSTDGFRYRGVFPLARQQAATARRCTAVLIITLLCILIGNLPGSYMAVVSAIVIAATPAISGGPIHKAFHRLLGLIIGGAYGITLLLILSHLPYLGMLLTLTVAAYFSLAYLFLRRQKINYALSQAGIVLTMILLGNGNSIGTLAEAIERLEGLICGGVIAILVVDFPPAPAQLPPAANTATTITETYS